MIKKEIFMKHVLITGTCWLWIGAIGDHGYGKCYINRRPYRAHRIAYQLFVGETPNGIQVCHTCDVRNCVNPEHLFLGTAKDNTQDAIQKNRFKLIPKDKQSDNRGSKNGMAKLTEEDVKEIKRLDLEGQHRIYIANKFNISQATVYDIRVGRRWKHI